MKKTLFLLALFTTMFVAAQDYNKWSIEPEFGVTKIRDVTPIQLFNTGIGARYMANTLFGAKLNANYTRLLDKDDLSFTNPINYTTASLHGVVNVGRLLKFESFSKHYTILSSIGGSYSYSEQPTNDLVLHRLSNFHLSASIDNEFKVSPRVFMTLGLDAITGVNSRPFTQTSSTETTTIINFNLGVTVALGNKQEHADWYIEEYISKVDTLFLKPTIIDNTITKVEVKEIVKDENEYVLFHHDSYVVDKDGLNAILRSADKLNDKNTISVIGFASPPGTDQYNMELSKNRAEAVVKKLLSLGVDKKQIILEYVGEVNTLDGQNVDLMRQVVLTINN
jgi:OOP family OmpA-OmpF porin